MGLGGGIMHVMYGADEVNDWMLLMSMTMRVTELGQINEWLHESWTGKYMMRAETTGNRLRWRENVS